MFTIRKTMLAAALISAALVGQAQTSRIRGTIESAQSNTLAVKLSDGAQSKVVLAPNANVIAVVKASMSDVKEGTFIGSAAMPQPDGTQRALEVHIFPEEMRGTGEGHRPYAPVPQGTMTNGATAGSPVKGVEGSTITIKYKEGEKKIVVPPNTPVVRYVIGSPADLKPGAHFTVLAATKKPDGNYEASRINVGRDGVVPQ
jgi:hypothetical protein